MQLLRVLWASPTTLLALAVCWPLVLLAGGETKLAQGVIEMHGPAIAYVLRNLSFVRGGARAMTLGYVVIVRSAHDLNRTRAHELVHVRQNERWGPLFLPAYMLASSLAWRRGEDPYCGNMCEKEAYGEA